MTFSISMTISGMHVKGIVRCSLVMLEQRSVLMCLSLLKDLSALHAHKPTVTALELPTRGTGRMV